MVEDILLNTRVVKLKTLPVHINEVRRAHFNEILDIEKESFPHAWLTGDLVDVLDHHTHNVGMVAENNGRVVGEFVYQLHKDRLEVLRFAVAADCRRRGVGSQMVARMVRKLSSGRRNRILVTVRETNVAAQLFFQSQGFRAIDVLRAHYKDTGEDGYMMCLPWYGGRR